MTNVYITNGMGYARVKIEGHAGYGAANHLPEGHDLVCASVSILGQTAMQIAIDMEQEKKVSIAQMTCTPGLIDLRILPKSAHAQELQDKIEAIRTGFEILSSTFSDYVKMGWGHRQIKSGMVYPDGKCLALGKDREL